MHALGVVAGFSAVSILSPLVVDSEIKAFTPVTRAVHLLALRMLQEPEARLVQCLQYFAKPLDRMIQAVAAPVFSTYDMFDKHLMISSMFCGSTVAVISTAVFSPLLFSIGIIMGLLQSTLLLLNGAFQVVVPYQALYAVYKGKEAAREYFDIRARWPENKFLTLQNPGVIEKPEESIDDLYKNHPPILELPRSIKDLPFIFFFDFINPAPRAHIMRLVLSV